jgi:hypothetical protein
LYLLGSFGKTRVYPPSSQPPFENKGIVLSQRKRDKRDKIRRTFLK